MALDIAVLAIPAIYGLSVLSRKGRLRSTAAALQVTYVREGWFRSGRIDGDTFTIRLASVRQSLCTQVEVPVQHLPGRYWLDARFFDGSPNWAHAKVPQIVSSRAFIVQVKFPGYAPATEEQRDVLWRWLSRSRDRQLPYDMLTAVKIKSIVISDEAVSTSFDGVMIDATRLRRALDLLQRLASSDRA